LSSATTIARFLLTLTIAMTYPMQNFFTRINLILLIRAFWEKFEGPSGKPMPESNPPVSNSMFYGTTFLYAFYDSFFFQQRIQRKAFSECMDLREFHGCRFMAVCGCKSTLWKGSPHPPYHPIKMYVCEWWRGGVHTPYR
jgi:hypothetical protein